MTVEVKCKQCGDVFYARGADIKRGWGKFCSKSCKAKHQERRTGQYARYRSRFRAAEHGGIPQFNSITGEYEGFCETGFDNSSCQNE